MLHAWNLPNALLSHDSNAQQLASQSLLFNFKKPLATDATEVDQTTCYLMALLSPSQRSSQLMMTPLRPGYLMTPRRISSEVLTKPAEYVCELSASICCSIITFLLLRFMPLELPPSIFAKLFHMLSHYNKNKHLVNTFAYIKKYHLWLI